MSKEIGEPVPQSDAPATLPADAKGYTRRLKMHMNFGPEGGAATYSIHDPAGAETPIAYQYDTRKGGVTGYSLPGVERAFKRWSDLVAYWPAFVKARAA